MSEMETSGAIEPETETKIATVSSPKRKKSSSLKSLILVLLLLIANISFVLLRPILQPPTLPQSLATTPEPPIQEQQTAEPQPLTIEGQELGDEFQEDIHVSQRRHFVGNRVKMESSGEVNLYERPLKDSLGLYEKKRGFGQPIMNQGEFQVWAIMRRQIKTGGSCAIINCYNQVSETTIQTAFALLNSSAIHKVILLTKERDSRSQDLLGKIDKTIYKVSNRKSQVDSDYNFILKETEGFDKAVYLFGSFELDSQMVLAIENEIAGFGSNCLVYSSVSKREGKEEKLISLKDTNLESIDPQMFYRYLYIFNASLLSVATPLNFAYYARYNFEELLILPVLALTQQSKGMKESQAVLHSFNTSFIQNIELPVRSPARETNSICFISYPSNPFSISISELNRYLDSIEAMATDKMSLSLVVYLPYKFESASELIKVNERLFRMKKSKKFTRVRLRIRAYKTLSTLAAYQSVYMFCPNESLIVTSRHNVRFEKEFAKEVLDKLSAKYHYIHTGFKTEEGEEVLIEQKLEYKERYQARRTDLFEKYFQPFQIYKSDFLKTNLFWVLKSEELDFYETESPLVILMMEETRLEFEYINKTLVTVGKREMAQIEREQIKNVKAYAEYTKLINNKLMPYRFNCLENKAYRRFAPDRMERKIHQIWISDQPVSKVRLVLHETIREKNPSFQLKLWKAGDITKQHFPATYQMAQRTFERHKDSTRSFFTLAADLLRYELILKYGGIYVDFKMEGKKALDPFLKYEVFYLDCDIADIRFGDPQAIGIGVMGSASGNFHIKKLLYEIIFEEQILFAPKIPKQTGGWKGRKSFTDEEFFTVLGLGYHLLFPLPYDNPVNACGGENKSFDPDQTVYDLVDVRSRKVIKIGLPCKEYPEAYLISYTPLAKTWLTTKSEQLRAQRIGRQ